MVTLERKEKIIRNQSKALQANKNRGVAVSLYAGAFFLVITLLTLSYGGKNLTPQQNDTVAAQAASKSSEVTSNQEKISVDQLSAASAVTQLAEMANLPVAGDLREATTTLYIKKQLAQNDTEVITKPQIVQPTTSTERGITDYVVKSGDTMESIAAQFGISAQTLKWANNSTSDAAQEGAILTVPRTDGVVYTVKDGDTVASLADKYKVDTERIVLYNDLASDESLVAGKRLVLPSGELPETERPGYVAPRPVTYDYSYTYSGGGGSSQIISRSYGYPGPTSGNRYAGGNCTWFAFERRAALGRPIGGLWGNASLWASSASRAGYVVNKTPAPGAIFQYGGGYGGYGHVGVVDSVDGEYLYVTDMNYAGYNVVTSRKIPLSSTGHYTYIH